MTGAGGRGRADAAAGATPASASIGRSAPGHDRGAGDAPLLVHDEGALAWAAARDGALRALVHALANRAGAVSAVAGMLVPDAAVAPPLAAALRGEGDRLLDLVELFRLLTPDPDGAPEPVHVPTALAEAARLVGEHPRLAGVTCDLVVAGGTPPALARADRVRLAAYLLAVAAADAGAEPVRLEAAGAPGAVVVRVPMDGEGGAAPVEARAAAWLLAAHGTVARADGAWTLTLPALGDRA